MRYKAVAFDLDGTLVSEKSSWYTLHRYFGTYEQSTRNMQAYEKEAITYQEFMRRDISLWQPRPHFNTLRNVLFNYSPTPNSEVATQILSEKGLTLFIVTTAPDFFANFVASKLKIQNVAANGMIFDGEGYITENTVFRVDLMKKEYAFETLLSKKGIECEECIAVGDSKFDRGFLKKAGLGVAFNPDTLLRHESNYIIDDMKDLLKFI
jgi:HAD superfamily PSPase-like hydrolase